MPDVDPPKRKYKLFNDVGFEDENPVQRDSQPYILDLVTLEILYFQTIPQEIEVTPESQFLAVASAGRNLPLFQYTGAEDTIKFSLSWYANLAHKEDAWKKAKWLQAMGKNNGFSERVHPVRFVMGNLFRKSKFLVVSAPAKLSLFDRSKGMMPCLINQDIELKRISEANQLRSEMLDLNT
jgi:hypothetical protein